MTPEQLSSEIQANLAPILAGITPPSDEEAVTVLVDHIVRELLEYREAGVLRFLNEKFDQAKHVVVHRGVVNPALCIVQYAYYFKHGPARNGQYVARILKSENGTYRIKTGVWDEGGLPFVDPAKRFSATAAVVTPVVEEPVVVVEPVVEPVVPVVVEAPPAVEEPYDIGGLNELIAQAEADPEGSVVVNYSTPSVEDVVAEATVVEPDVTAALREKTYEVEGLTELVGQPAAVTYPDPLNTDFMTKPVTAPRGYTRKSKKAAKETPVVEVEPTTPVDPEEPKD